MCRCVMQPKTPSQDDDEDDEVWRRQYTMPEEYIRAHCGPTAWNGFHRWFVSPNIVDLVRIRRLRQNTNQAQRLRS